MPILQKIAKKLYDTWGREADKEENLDAVLWPPQSNPDTTTSNTLYDTSQIPAVVAGLQRRGISRLVVSAGGIDPDEESGAYFPPQLTYPREGGNPEILEALAFQYDHGFQKSFASIVKEIDDACLTYGYAIIEIGWHLKEDEPFKGKLFAHVYSRDPDSYIFDYEGEEGIFKETDYGLTPVRMNPTAFLSYAFNPLFGNKYGRSINLPLQPWLQTAKQIFDYWRKALENAGYGNWIAHYPKRYAGKDEKSVSWRKNLMDELKLLYAGCRTIVEEGVEIAPQKLVFEAQAFLDWWDIFEKTISLIYTGSQTTMVEGKFSSQAEIEGGQARERSYLEQDDNIRVCDFWNTFGELFVNINFMPEQHGGIYPKLSFIPPQLILPTTPKNQEEVDEVDTETETIEPKETPEEEQKELAASGKFQEMSARDYYLNEYSIRELQEEEQEKPKQPPVAIPAGYQDFPRETPLPEPYRGVIEAAEDYLAEMPAKPYNKVLAADASKTFTIKRLRSFENDAELVEDLKNAIIPTLSAENERDAWEGYYNSAVGVFANYGLEIDPAIRDDLRISFRQARQNAFSGGLIESGKASGAVGVRIHNLEDGHDIRTEHKLWDDVALAFEHPRFDEIVTPTDFGCVCFNSLVFDVSELTQDADLPETSMGGTYKYYAPQEAEEGENE